MNITQILVECQNLDHSTRSQAESQLQKLENENFTLFFGSLALELNCEDRPGNIRTLAGLVMKNAVSAREEVRINMLADRWMNVDEKARFEIKRLIIGTLGSSNNEARHTAAQVAAKIAVVELPRGQWQDLIRILLQGMDPKVSNDFLKQASLETLGYLCEDIDPKVLENRSNEILTAVVQGMRPEETSLNVRTAASNALFNSLEFIKSNFEVEKERDYIVHVMIQGTMCKESEKIRCVSFECLTKCASLYYNKISQYMQQIFNATLGSIKEDTETVALQAIEFWSNLAEVEEILKEDAEEAVKSGETVTEPSQNFVLGAIKYLIPVLLETLTKQEEDQDEDSWNLATSGGTCLSLVTLAVGDTIVDYVMPFVTKFINDGEWRFREAATLALGSILEGRENVQEIIDGAVPVLLQHMNDPVELVKDTSAWCIGRICALHAHAAAKFLPNIMQAVLRGLTDVPKVAANCCWVLSNLSESYEDEETNDGVTKYSPYFQHCMQALLAASQREDSDENKLKVVAFAAMGTLIRTSPSGNIALILQTVNVFVESLERTFTMEVQTQDDAALQNTTQVLLLSVLQEICLKVESQINPFAGRIMNDLFQIFNFKAATLQEEALMLVGALAAAMGPEFVAYVQAVIPLLHAGLANVQEHEVCYAAVGCVGDISRAIGSKIAPFCKDLFTVLLQDLQSPQLDRSVKPSILSTFGDIALAVEGGFVQYLPVVADVLAQAAQTIVDTSDEDQVDYLNSLREGIFEAYTGTIQGLREGNQSNQFVPYVNSVVNFINLVYSDPENLRSEAVNRGMVGVIGDIAHSLRSVPEVKHTISQRFIKLIINDIATTSTNEGTVEVATWTKGILERALTDKG